eukprot:1484552-Amphidinium_carterae.1
MQTTRTSNCSHKRIANITKRSVHDVSFRQSTWKHAALSALWVMIAARSTSLSVSTLFPHLEKQPPV